MPKGYDEDLDTEMQMIGSVSVGDTSTVYVSVRSYDGAEPKVAVTKEVRGYVNAKLGRLEAAHAREVAGLMVQAADWIEGYLGR